VAVLMRVPAGDSVLGAVRMLVVVIARLPLHFGHVALQ
jgi:hypothetical protein